MPRMPRRVEIRFPDELSERLTQVARREGCSVATLIREAVTERYGAASREEKLAAVDRLAALEGPVGSWGQMEEEIVAGALGVRRAEGR
jgi:predicted DNA-binding protein